MQAKDIIKVMEKHYPIDLQESWDHCGLQCGNIDQVVSKVMISLNADIDSLMECIEAGCQMLITHHPFLFNSLTLDLSTHTGKFIELAMNHHIVVYSAHTSLDKISMNNWLIAQLPVHDIEEADDTQISRKAKLDHVYTKEEFFDLVKETYHVKTLRYAGEVKSIERVAICGGAGADFIEEIAPQVDAYITGDTKYHQGQDLKDCVLIDVGHHIEVIMVSQLKDLLSKDLDVDFVECSSPNYFKEY